MAYSYYGEMLVNPILINFVKLQKWAIRVISNCHYRCHTGPLFAKCNFLTVTDMYSLELGVFMYEFSTNDLPLAFKECFKLSLS